MDHKKRFLWASPRHCGAAFDARALSETILHSELDMLEVVLVECGLWLAGDSAYHLKGHTMIPYSAAGFMSDEDNFNFWLSNSRICVECAFGELVWRWGVFWHPQS